MTVAKQGLVRLSSKGQLVIPRGIREQLGWRTEMELLIVPTGNGVMLWPKPEKSGKRLESLRGCLGYSGSRLSDAELNAPVFYVNGKGSEQFQVRGE